MYRILAISSLLAFVAAGPATAQQQPLLSVERETGGGVALSWTGGLSPYDLYAGSDPSQLLGWPNQIGSTFSTSFVDLDTPGDLVFYRVLSGAVCATGLAVGYVANGNTCGFIGNPGAPDLPGLALDEYRYNEFFTGAGYGGPFDPTNPLFSALGEARGCGACLEITGENGSIVGIVREIADVGSVGTNAYPNGVHIDMDAIDQVRPTAGSGVDITMRPVPCPVAGNAMIAYRMYNANQAWYWTALDYVVYNHRVPILSVEIQADVGHDAWYPLDPNWTGRWRGGAGFGDPIPLPNPPNGPVRFRITSLDGEVLVSDPIQQPERPVPGATTQDFYFDTGVQFADRPIVLGGCLENVSCGNWQIDPGEECEITWGDPGVDCAAIGAGSGTAYCDPLACSWDRSTCSP